MTKTMNHGTLLAAVAVLAACSSSHGVPDGGSDASMADSALPDGRVDSGGHLCGASSCSRDETCCLGCTPAEGFCQPAGAPCPAFACPPPGVTDCSEAEGAPDGAPCDGTFECTTDDGCCFTTQACVEGSLVTRESLCLDDCLPPLDCDGLGPADCAAAGCVPTYDDACAPVCTDGPHTDCFDPTYFVCRPFEDACGAAFCSRTADWSCADEPADCSRARAIDEDSCDLFGCVPSVGPVGSPELPPRCVPITAASCTTACRTLPPECPTGTVAEGDGSCYTGRCIPGFVCD